MLHKETVSVELLALLENLMSIPELNSFRLVGGTAIALQIGHRKSVDIDLFSNEKVDKPRIRQALNEKFPTTKINVTQDNLTTEINGVRVDLYDDWMIPFKQKPVVEEGLRLATLNDLAAFKLSAITSRREKKDYIDLFFLFKQLGMQQVLNDFEQYDPLLSPKSILFALSEVKTAQENKSPMPDMVINFSWNEIIETMIQAAQSYFEISKRK